MAKKKQDVQYSNQVFENKEQLTNIDIEYLAIKLLSFSR